MANKFTVSTVFSAVDSMTGPIGKMNASVDKLGKNVAGNNKRIAQNFGGIGKIVGGVASAIAAAAIAAGTAMTKLSRDVALAGDEIAKTARYLGMTADRLQEFRYIGELSGVTIQEMDKSLTKLSVNLGKDSSEVQEALDMLGISVEDLKAAGPDESLYLISDAFKNLTDPIDKSTVAYALFGKSGMKMINVLDQGSEGIAALSAEAHDLGYVMDSELLTASENLNDDILRMKTTFKAVQNMLASEFIPIINNVVDKITEMSKESKSKFAGAFTGIANVLAELFITIMPVLDSVFSLLIPLLGLLATILQQLAPLFVMVAQIIEKLVPVVGLLVEIITVALGPALNVVVLALEPVLDWLDLLLKILAPVLKGILWLSKVITNVFGKIPQPIKSAMLVIMGLLNPMIGFPFILAGVWRPLKSIIPDVIEGIVTAAKAMGEFFKNLWSDITEIFKIAIDVILLLLSPLISTLNLVGSGLNLIGINVPQIGKNNTPMSSKTTNIKSTTNKSVLDVNFNNLPDGTRTKQTGQAPGINVNMGYAYAYTNFGG